MKAAGKSISSDGKPRKILLIGDISRVFLDTGDIAKLCEVHTDIPDGVAAAAKDNFAGIAIMVSGTSGKLRSALKSLREANRGAKIILLARMCEEPAARQLVARVRNGRSLADDYLICPIHFSYLESYMSHLTSDRSAALQDVAMKKRWGEVGLSAAIDSSFAVAAAEKDAQTKKKVEALEKLATEDDLTGLKNRRYIWEFSRQIIERARKENGRVTLLAFDIDDFKRYNDTYGHRAGDEVLKQASILMRRCCRQHDIVGRIGGDEFAVVFWDDPQRQPAGTSAPVSLASASLDASRGSRRQEDAGERRSAMADHPREAIFIAKRLVRELEKAELSGFSGLGPEGKGVLAISGGLASFPRDGSTIQELFQRADEALLDAKRSGKNRIYLVGKPQSDITDIQ
jgi:GGDEF domain-containing protein